MFWLPRSRLTIDFHLPVIGTAAALEYTPGEVSVRPIRRVPPPCQDAMPKKMAFLAAFVGFSETLTLAKLASPTGEILMVASTLPTLRGSGMNTEAISTRPAATSAPAGTGPLPFRYARPNPEPRMLAAMAAGVASRSVGRRSCDDPRPAGDHPEALYQIMSPASPAVPTSAPATSPNRSRLWVPTHHAAASTARADGRYSGKRANS